MNLETIIKRMDALEERIQDYDKIFKNFNDTIADLNNKVTNLPAEYHDLKDEIGQLRKSIAGIGNFDKALTQIRKDTNEKIENLEKEAKKQQEQQTNLYQSDMRSLSAKVDRLDTKVKSELDKKIQRYIEEDSHVLSTVERIEQSVNTKLKSDEDVRRNHEIQKRDIQSISKRLEILGDDVSQFQKQQVDITNKLAILSDSSKQVETQINELKVSETQRKMAQNAFIEQQEIAQKQRELRVDEIQRKASEEILRISPMLEKLVQKEKELTQIGNDLDEVTKLYERRLKEVSELYQLFEAKYQKEWNGFKNEIERNWSNFSLINDEKQSAFTNRMDELKSRIFLLEDQTKDIQELLGLMSEEIQKGMLSLLKMANNWKDAFDNIQGK
jgi:chromosome segregation ATPase